MAQQPSTTGYASSSRERGGGSQSQVGHNFPESQYPAEHPATTGTSFSQHYPQQGRTVNRAHSSQNFLHPEAIERRPSTSSTRTSNEGRDGPCAGQPIRLEFRHPLSSEIQRGERYHEQECAPSRSGRSDEGPPPPPGLRVNEVRAQDVRPHNTRSPETKPGCLQCFR